MNCCDAVNQRRVNFATCKSGAIISLLAAALVTLAATCLFATVARADPPETLYIFPAGAQRGTEVSFRVGGLYLHESCPFEMLGPGVTASPRVEQTETVWFEGPFIVFPESSSAEVYPRDMTGRVRVDADAPLGPRPWRVWTAQGAAAARPFVIGNLPEIVEEEIDGRPLPVSVTLPVTVNGRIFPREDVDIWSFEAKAGQEVTCAAIAAGLGSPLEVRLEIRDVHGRRIAESDDRPPSGTEALARFVVPADGTYQVHIRDEKSGGLQNYVYRLTLTDGPFIDGVFPLGGRRGSRVALELSGQNLPAVPVPLDLPATAPAGYSTELKFGNALTNSFSFELDDLPELVEQGPNDELSQAAPVKTPVVFNGRIERPGDVDHWAFQGVKDAVYEIDLRAARLRSPLDSVLALFDDSGKELARSDDLASGQTDSFLRFTVPADGAYIVRVEERLESRGGSTFAYRLRVAAPPPPDFRLLLAANALSLDRGAEAKLKMKIERIGGFADEIQLGCENLPAGVTFTPARVDKNVNEVELVFKAEKTTAPITARGLVIQGTAHIGDRSVLHHATFQAAPPVSLEVDSLLLAVAVPTPYKVHGVFEVRYAERGGDFVRHLSIDRGGFEGPLTVRMADRQMRHQQGVTGPTVTVPSGVSEFDYRISLPPWMEIGRTSRSCVMVVGEVADPDGTKHTVSFTSLFEFEQIVAIIDPGQFNIEIERPSVAAAPGNVRELPIRLQRGTGVNGDVVIELIVPRHIRGVSAEPIVVPAGNDAGSLSLRFAPTRDCGPFNMPLVVRAVTRKGDQSRVVAEAPIEIVKLRE